MSNYYGQMMNIQMPEDGRIKYNLDEQPDMTDVIAYKFGHRDARHAAAEIAAQADEEIDSLKVVNSQLRGQLDREWSIAHSAEIQLAVAHQRITELQARLRAWEETAEHYCAPNTPISADGVRGYIAEMEAQLAAAKDDFARLRIFAADLHDLACNGQLDPDLLAMRGVNWVTGSYRIPSPEEVESAYESLEKSGA